MFTFPVSTFVRTAAAAVVIGAVSLGTAGLACAERPLTQDDRNFIEGLQAEDIGFDTPATAINVAHAVCNDIADGASYGGLVDVTLESTDLTVEQAEVLVGESVWFYCPQFIPEIGS